MIINGWLQGEETLIARFREMPANIVKALRPRVERQAIELTRYVKDEKLSGQVLKTGPSSHLRGSIHYELTMGDQEMTAIVGTNVEYAHIHEYGGQTRAHVIEARNAKCLHFFMDGKEMFLRRVNHPGSKMPERSFLRSSLRERGAAIRADLEAGVMEGINA
jgi:phage gpG-like protein